MSDSALNIAIITGLAAELDCRYEKHSNLWEGEFGIHKWTTNDDLEFTVMIHGDLLSVQLTGSTLRKTDNYALADPNLIEKLRKLIDTYRRYTRHTLLSISICHEDSKTERDG